MNHFAFEHKVCVCVGGYEMSLKWELMVRGNDYIDKIIIKIKHSIYIHRKYTFWFSQILHESVSSHQKKMLKDNVKIFIFQKL